METVKICNYNIPKDHFVIDMDGYVKYFPPVGVSGFFDAYILRGLADYLDQRNFEWDEQVTAYFKNDSGCTSADGTCIQGA